MTQIKAQNLLRRRMRKTKSKKQPTKKPKEPKTETAEEAYEVRDPSTWNKFPKPTPDEVIRDINMRYGDYGPVVRSANNAWDVSDLRRPSGIPSLDIAAGGGLIAGKVHQFDGPEGIGKNFLLYKHFAEIQRRYGDKSCLGMACFESFVDKQFAQQCGCKISMSEYDVAVSQRARKRRGEPPLTKEEIKEAISCEKVGAFHIFDSDTESVLDGLVKAASTNIYQMIGIDSWDAMITAQEETSDLDEIPQIASSSMLQTRWGKKILDSLGPVYRCPKCGHLPVSKKVINSNEGKYHYTCGKCSDWKGLYPAVEINETTIYCIRQVRAKIRTTGKVMGRPYDATGARMLNHLYHIRVSMHPGPFIKMKSDEIIGKEINWEIRKAKGGAREKAKGAFNLYFSPLEADVVTDLIDLSRKLGLIEGDGSGHYKVLGKNIHGKGKLISELENNRELFDSLLDKAYIDSGLAHVRFI